MIKDPESSNLLDTIQEFKPPKVQAENVVYELHSLGWKAFQNLCVTITREMWGQTVQGFFDSNDGGRDGAFYGSWQTKNGELFAGSFVVQCKFTSILNKQIKPSDLGDELEKVTCLAARGLADNYFLFTNAHLQGTSAEEISTMFQKVPGIKRCVVYGSESISQFIRESSRLRMLVPRVYGLGDLSQIFDERAYDQAREILSALGDDLAKFVITDAYTRSAKALVDHGFVLLLGEPACGKSTIAAALAVGALDEWECSILKIRDAEDFVKHSNSNEPKQFFWVDDAFGPTQFDWSMANGWNRAFPHIQAAIRRGARVVFTSRDHIYRSARQHLKESALPIIKESQVVIQVENLTKEEREQILYNHIRLGSQPKEFKTKLKEFLPTVAVHSQFSPEIARRLGNPAFTEQLHISKFYLDDFVAHPLDLLCEIIRTIDADSRSALALVFMRAGILPSPIQMTKEEENAVKLLGGSLAGIRTAVNSFNGSLLLQSMQEGNYVWRFKHPTIRDAFAVLVAEDRELMDIYLAGTPIERLFQEISCGNVGMEGVKVIVPSDRYDAFMVRIESFGSKRENKDSLHRFLASRCERDFLARYIARYPQFISQLKISSYFYAISDIDVLVRLHQFNLLHETTRQSAVKIIRELAIETPDAGFLRKGMRELFTEDELKDICEQVRQVLLPTLSDVISDWRGNYDSDHNEPEDYFSELTSALQDYRDEFVDDQEAVAYLENAMTKIQEVINDLNADKPSKDDSGDFYGSSSSSEEHDSSRSIFDDVDH